MYFPPAFQVLSLALLAAFGWSANLLLLARAGIAARPILQLAQLPLTHGDADGVDVRLHRPIARLATVLSGIALVGWCLCALSATATARAAIILLTYLAIAAALLMPRRVLCHIVRMQFVALLVRIVKPSLSDPVFLADIVMADILTSCARLFSDLFVVVCQLVAILGHGDAAGSARSGRIGTLLVCAPYAFRLRQCINECLKADPKSGDARRHLANAVKYASSFPVIVLAAAQHQVSAKDVAGSGYSGHSTWWLWFAAATLNSLYSFYWDIAFDWDLGHTVGGWKLADLITSPDGCASADLRPMDASGRSMSKAEFPRLLRPRLYFASARLYYAAAALDLVLRFAWAARLCHYLQIDQSAYGGVWLAALEIYRRWQWTFLRIEKEAAA